MANHVNGLVGRLQSLFSGAPSAPAAAPEDPMQLRQLRKEVCKGLIEVLQPVLQAEGFSPFVNGTTWRHTQQWVDVIQIQFIRTDQNLPHSPSLHVGRYFHVVPERDLHSPVKRREGKYFPSPEQCHIRKTIVKPARDRKGAPNIWPIGPAGEGLEQCIAQALALTQSHILPWCRWLDAPRNALEMVLRGVSDVDGNSSDPVLCGSWNYESHFGQHVLAGMLAFQLGRWQMAIGLLEPVLAQGGTLGRAQRLVPLPAPALEQIARALATAQRNR